MVNSNDNYVTVLLLVGRYRIKMTQMNEIDRIQTNITDQEANNAEQTVTSGNNGDKWDQLLSFL